MLLAQLGDSMTRLRDSLLLLIAGVGAAFAQDFRATILGQVLDPSGGAIPNAIVKATRVDNNQSVEVRTNTEGVYSIPFLNPGTYNLEASAPGFKITKREAIAVLTADKLNIPLKLQVGDITQEVTVVGEQEVLDTGSASRGLNFDPVKTQEYPLNGRQTYMLLALTPGVLFTQEQFGATGFSGTRGWDVNSSYKINGGRTGSSQFLLNGAPISDKDGTWQLAPNVEAVQEFKVMTNTYDAQFGRFAGGVVNTTLKSGTNAYHGSVFEFFRNSVLDANTTQNNRVGATRGKHNQHQYGYAVGGPIPGRKDKDWFFTSLEGWREVIPFSRVSDVPPLALRDGQHFTDYGFKIYDPLTTHCEQPNNPTCAGSRYIRNPFDGNVIPQSRMSPIGVKILSYYPKPNGNFDALSQNFFATSNAGRYHYNQPMGRWDHNFSQNDRLYALFTYQHGYEYRNQTGFPPPAGSGDIFSQRTDQNYIADWTHVLSPSSVLDVRGSFGRFTSLFPRYTDFSLTADQLGIKQIIHAPTVTSNTAPVVTLQDYSQLFGLSNSDVASWSTYNQADFAPSITMTRGKHNYHFGFEYNYVAKGTNNNGEAFGQFNFDRYWTQQLRDQGQGAKDGSSIAAMLLGLPSNTGNDASRVDYRDTFYRSRPYYAFYAQDDWRITPTFILNIGLRYDIQIPFLERYNRLNAGYDFVNKNPLSDKIIAKWTQLKADYDAANPGAKYKYPDPPKAIIGGLLFAGAGGQPRRPYDTDWNGIAPRIGFAWQFMPKTVLRGGFGMFYQPQTQENTTTGYTQTTTYVRTLDGILPSGGLTGPYSLEQPYPNGLLPVAGASLGLLTNVGNGISFDTRSIPLPRSYQYSLGFERQLPYNMVLEVSYTGNYTVHNTQNFNFDDVSQADRTVGIGDPNYLNRQLPSPFFGILPASSTSGASTTINAFELLRPIPVFRGITNNTLPINHYRYDSLQVLLEKRLMGGSKSGVFTAAVSYTFSKAFEQNHRLNNVNPLEQPIHELDNTDKPQSIAVSGVWDLPLGKGRHWANFSNPVASTLISNWRTTWIFTYYSGYPVGWPDLIYNCGPSYNAPGGQNSDHWFNNDKSCYQTRPPFTYRVVPDRFPNIRNPSEPQINMSVEKTIPFKEHYSLQLRGEAFNITNTVILQGPNTTFDSSQFGRLPLTQNNFPRLVQLAAKFVF
jgi:carboxypeptidase family protein